MKLLPRLFLSHALVVFLTVLTMLVLAETFASGFIRHHVEEMVRVIGPRGLGMRGDLTRGMRDAFTGALLIAAPVALLVAFIAAFTASQRVVRAVNLLRSGSRALAGGEYTRRLPEEGQDELTDLARHFNRMADALAQVEASRVDLITNVAHELRTPLTALRGYAEALTDGVLPPAQAAPAILRETRAMERLANDLSLVSRVEAGAVELQTVPLPVLPLLTEAYERFEALAVDRGVHLTLRAVPADVRVRADPERAAQVLANLIGNALKYTPRGGAVTVSVAQDARHVQVQVADTGPGLSVADQARIFERFYRVDQSRSRSGGGSGVGLTIARGLARAMGGDVTVRSAPGEGSCFTLRLPAARP